MKNTSAKSTEYWRYPEHDGYPPKGQTLFLLTKGGIPVIGTWMDKGFIGWAPMFLHDRTKEPQTPLPYTPPSTKL